MLDFMLKVLSCSKELKTSENYMYKTKYTLTCMYIWIQVHNIYTTKGTSSPILRRSEEERFKVCDMKT